MSWALWNGHLGVGCTCGLSGFLPTHEEKLVDVLYVDEGPREIVAVIDAL